MFVIEDSNEPGRPSSCFVIAYILSNYFELLQFWYIRCVRLTMFYEFILKVIAPQNVGHSLTLISPSFVLKCRTLWFKHKDKGCILKIYPTLYNLSIKS